MSVKFSIIATAFVLSAASTAFAQDIGGTYRVDGTNFDGSHYKGTVKITATSNSTCKISWNTGGNSSGLCMRSGNILAASYTADGGKGLVIYEIHRDGTLVGTWTLAGADGIGTELLSPQ